MSNVKGLMCMVAAAAAGTSIAQAQSACDRPIGPDVIVGSLMAGTNGSDTTGPAANYAATATHDAFSMGTYSCNVGDVWLNWIAGTNQHPVIGQNCYKFKVVNGAGRFEQLGQSWLKHGFYALSNTLCCANCLATDGTHLGVRCSDPYTAGRNGGQTSAGPKWQVNAYTGAFTYPPANPPGGTATAVARRLAILKTDLEPSSASVQYFGEGQYISNDEAIVGNTNGTHNQNNNASFRRITVTGGPADYTFSFVAGDLTQRERPAIAAWPGLEPGVTLTSFQIPNEGLVYIGSKATAMGGGRWHYEYAVYNMNSDLSIGGFSVPLVAEATAMNIGFRDVDYRDGDGINNVNIDGTDWAGVKGSSDISWNTVPFAVNANGNAVRWGTLYNFRFDTNVAPVNGSATITTWKSVASYQVAAQVPGGGPTTCYANCDGSTADPCLNAADFGCFLNAFASGSSVANCDLSTAPPVLNISDFTCFLNTFFAGCTNC
jgi:hypothetical protein